MKAYQFDTVEAGLELRDVETPTPGANEVVVTVEASGLCHSDCHILKGQADSWTSKRPITLGHEIAGTVSGLGSGVSQFKVGDLVAVALPSDPMDDMNDQLVGVGRDGGYAEKVVVDERVVVRIPEGVTLPQAAVATDSISTAYHAIVAEAKVTSTTTVAVVGLGGLGLNGLRIAAIQGATVYGVDIDDKKFDHAIQLGAKACFRNLSEAAQLASIDVVVDFAGVGVTTTDAMKFVRAGGTIVLVGLGVPTIQVSSHVLIIRSLVLRGSRGSTINEYREVLKLIAAGLIVPQLEEIPFSEVPRGLERLERLEVTGRLFTRPNANLDR